MIVKKYMSKVSYGLLAFIFFVFFWPLISIMQSNEISLEEIGILVFLLVLFGFILHMFLKTEYVISNDELIVKCGFFRYKPINVDEIREISKTRNLLSSPAPSFDRIEIKYGKFDFIILSPRDKCRFAEDLVKINPSIKNNILEE